MPIRPQSCSGSRAELPEPKLFPNTPLTGVDFSAIMVHI
jgi:hypothetical protein